MSVDSSFSFPPHCRRHYVPVDVARNHGATMSITSATLGAATSVLALLVSPQFSQTDAQTGQNDQAMTATRRLGALFGQPHEHFDPEPRVTSPWDHDPNKGHGEVAHGVMGGADGKAQYLLERRMRHSGGRPLVEGTLPPNAI
jgi:hypothetical protein